MKHKPIHGFPKYTIKPCGRTAEIIGARGRPLKFFLNHKGYETVALSANGKLATKFVHRLIYEYFHGEIPNTQPKMQINHIDGDKRNNSIENLELVTGQENQSHAYHAGLCNRPKATVFENFVTGESRTFFSRRSEEAMTNCHHTRILGDTSPCPECQPKKKPWNICDSCAAERKWEPPTWAVTVMQGTCGYCGAEDVMLTPVCDFRRPGGRDVVWD